MPSGEASKEGCHKKTHKKVSSDGDFASSPPTRGLRSGILAVTTPHRFVKKSGPQAETLPFLISLSPLFLDFRLCPGKTFLINSKSRRALFYSNFVLSIRRMRRGVIKSASRAKGPGVSQLSPWHAQDLARDPRRIRGGTGRAGTRSYN